MKLATTYLIVPGNRPDRFDKALASGADAVVLDLEDAVRVEDKDVARDHVKRWLDAHAGDADRVLVRINDRASPAFHADLALVRHSGVRLAMLPKTETAAEVESVQAALSPGGFVLPMIETARGVANVQAIAAARGVLRLAFGTLDYAADLDLSGDERGFAYPSARIALASRCAGIASPVAGVTVAIDDEARLVADVAFARAFGFGAKLCVHPRQVAVFRDAMRPTAAEVDWAQRVIAAAQGAPGAVQIDGRLVDRPVLLTARAILDRAAR
jgi:citrate lyase subunit beta/citryl-CoA lyase